MSQSYIISRDRTAALVRQSDAFLLERIYAQAARIQRNVRGAQQFASYCPNGERKPSHEELVYNPANGKFQPRG